MVASITSLLSFQENPAVATSPVTSGNFGGETSRAARLSSRVRLKTRPLAVSFQRVRAAMNFNDRLSSRPAAIRIARPAATRASGQPSPARKKTKGNHGPRRARDARDFPASPVYASRTREGTSASFPGRWVLCLQREPDDGQSDRRSRTADRARGLISILANPRFISISAPVIA